MPIYFTGQTGPALPLNSIQYNAAGVQAGDANLTWVPASGLHVGPAFAGLPAYIQAEMSPAQLEVTKTNDSLLTALGVGSATASGNSYIFVVSGTLSGGAGYIDGIFLNPGLSGTSTGDVYGLDIEPQVGVGGGPAVVAGTIYGVYVNNTFFDSSTADAFYGVSFGGSNTGSESIYGYHSDDLTGMATNSYYSWFDSRGVLRVREDSTFNSVGQAIQALYNPQFTKYTPGAVNYERIIFGQWSSNVGQIGIEAGGTGVLRAVDFIGASAGFPLSATNGQNFAIKILTELTTIAAAATTDTAIQIPANAVVFGVDVRVTVAIPTAATFTVIGAGSATVFNTAAVTVAANSTNQGTKSCPFYNATAQAIRITPDIQPGANTGRLRVTIHYYEVTAATS